MKWTRQRCPVEGQNLGDGGLQALVCIGDHRLDAAQDSRPEGYSLRGSDIEAQDIPPIVAVHPHRDDHGERRGRVQANACFRMSLRSYMM